MYESRSGAAGSSALDRPTGHGMQVVPTAFQRRLRQLDAAEGSAPGGLQRDVPERASLTSAMRKNYLKELLLSNPAHSSGLSSVLSAQSCGADSEPDSDWALSPMEHAWMLSAVEGSYETILEFISLDPNLLNRKDFISGYSVLHWLAKRGQDETLLQLLRHAGGAGIPVNVNLRGGGGLTPLHVASMHRQYTVIKVLVGAFGADVDAMDYSGRRAWQYLRGDAPLEMKELLGTWDDEHRSGCTQNLNNNSSSATATVSARDEEPGDTRDLNPFERTHRGTSWLFGSLRRMIPSFSGNRI